MSYQEQQLQKRIGKLVTEARSALGMSRPKLAKESGVSLRTLHSFEHGETWPQSTTLKAISDALNWDMHRITRLLASTKTPDEVTLEDVEVDPWGKERPRYVSDLSDEELLAELTFRFHQRNAELRKLREPRSNVTPLRPEFNEALPHAAHPPLRMESSQYDDLGEDPQD
ncbi:helix-turn-helix domain-containing protein [Glutamicibacter sp. MCAF14]|uniref:helix-turn-helix domain-containing protein n=1 Tax=Glutamicibacter sp. MCAF14 TaxID=3233043 RepID=UPI003F909E2B